MTSSLASCLEEPPVLLTELRSEAPKPAHSEKPARPLLWNVIWMLAGNFANGFSQWAFLIVLAKLGTSEMVGTYALAMAIALPVLMLTSLNFRPIQATDSERAYRFLDFASIRMLMVAISIVLMTAAGLFLQSSRTLLPVLALVGVGKAFEYLSDVLYGALQQREDMAGIAISMLLRSSFSVFALGLTVYLTHSLLFAIASVVVCAGAVLFGYDIPKAIGDRTHGFRAEIGNVAGYWHQLGNDGNHQRLKRLAFTGLPMGIALMMVSLNLNIPRYFIQQQLGTSELGIFSAISTILTSGSVAINAIGQAAAPRMASAFAHRNRRRFGQLVLGLVAASLGLGSLGLLAATLFGRQAMSFLFRPEYSTHHDVLIWLMAASGLYYLGSTLGYAVTAVRCFSPQLPLFVLSTLTTAISCIILMPSFGLRGASISILVSSFVQCVGSLLLLRHAYRKANNEISDIWAGQTSRSK